MAFVRLTLTAQHHLLHRHRYQRHRPQIKMTEEQSIKFYKLSPSAILPTRGSKYAAGVDLHSARNVTVAARKHSLILTDLQVQLPMGTYGRVAPRSGLAYKYGIDVGAGVIDADYRGNIGVILFNHSDVPFIVTQGDRIAQLICERVVVPDIVAAQMPLSVTERNDRGFGSTGIRQHKFNIIVAMTSNNRGIGYCGNFPWAEAMLKTDIKLFSSLTRGKQNPEKCNAVIMGRLTYESIPVDKRPLTGRINIILSNSMKPSDVDENVFVCKSFHEALELLETDARIKDIVDNIWIIGGSRVYREAINSPYCRRIYVTEIYKDFPADVHFPEIPNNFKLISPSSSSVLSIEENGEQIPLGIQCENGIEYEFKIYEKI